MHGSSHGDVILRNEAGLGRDLSPAFNIDFKMPGQGQNELFVKLQKSEAVVWRGENWSRQG